MKAFVIKNKEGKYWCGNDIFSATIDIRTIYICEDFDFVSKVINKLSSEGLLKDCVVVEITIAEEDKNLNPQNYENLSVEDKLKYRDKQVRLAVERSVDDYNKITDLEFHIKRLEEQLAEKDKEIEKLYKILDSQKRHIDNIEQHFWGHGTKRTGDVILDFKLQIRKQVCDEIRKIIECHSEWYEQGYVIDMVTEDLLKEIDKIEQAKE